ncbi:hypothetical protein BJF78_24805 [Pseudonocardia sp. CNS-139]|nr:hypothetical protein BJF78_24805 [Pseudonocardia sp. CNS-139]
MWPAGDYGVHGAEQKAQKTWTTCDLAVSVASGTDWLGRFPIDTPGPVVMFVGEGGEANTLRRLNALGEARGIDAEELPIVVCARAPHLASNVHMALVAEAVERIQPVLVTLDPLYLAAGGANLADLYGMGALLERPQLICQRYGASLWVAHHHNRKQGSGAGRMSGAGPAEWGRVLLSADVKSRRRDEETGGSDVVTEIDVIGGEVPDQCFRVRRRIWADDPDDLDSPLHLVTIVSDTDDDTSTGAQDSSTRRDLAPAAVKLLEALQAAERPCTTKELGDWIADKFGTGLKRQTMSTQLNELARRGLVSSSEINNGTRFSAKVWVLAASDDAVSPRVSDTSARHGEAPVSPVSPPLYGDTVTATRTRRHGGAGGSADTGRRLTQPPLPPLPTSRRATHRTRLLPVVRLPRWRQPRGGRAAVTPDGGSPLAHLPGALPSEALPDLTPNRRRPDDSRPSEPARPGNHRRPAARARRGRPPRSRQPHRRRTRCPDAAEDGIDIEDVVLFLAELLLARVRAAGVDSTLWTNCALASCADWSTE